MREFILAFVLILCVSRSSFGYSAHTRISDESVFDCHAKSQIPMIDQHVFSIVREGTILVGKIDGKPIDDLEEVIEGEMETLTPDIEDFFRTTLRKINETTGDTGIIPESVKYYQPFQIGGSSFPLALVKVYGESEGQDAESLAKPKFLGWLLYLMGFYGCYPSQ